MIHRDFKPDNVMITSDGQVRVMDFGLARQFGAEEPLHRAPPRPLSQEFEQLAELGEPPPQVDLDATAKLGVGGVAPAPTSSSGSYLQQKLTQTGALVGTPAYMAPEQFAGTETDARTDQFSFCVALYEALYGERPFEGDNVIALMANVVSGTFRPERAGTAVPPRLRKILLRGLSPDPDDRFPSMADLLLELEKDPASLRRVRLTSVTVGAVLLALLVGVGRHLSSANAMCGGAGARLAEIWGFDGDSPRKRQIEQLFEAKGPGNAARLFASVSSLLDGYVGRWAAMYREVCEATHVRGDQSAEVLDLRMACLGQRLTSVKALTDVLANADASVIDNAVSAAGALPTLERCADVAMLRSVVQPPSDAPMLARVERVRGQVAKARALGDAGQCTQAEDAANIALNDARAVGYLPLVAEAAYVAGQSGMFCSASPLARTRLEEAVWAAESAHDDELTVEASAAAATNYAERSRDAATARLWIKHADSILKRLPGHPMLEVYATVDRGMVDLVEGRGAEALEEQKSALAIKERILGPLHPDTALSAMNVGVGLHEQGRDAEAEPFGRRAVETLERLLGADSTWVAIARLDWAEVLTALGRTREAREVLNRAIAVWTKLGASALFVGAGYVDLSRVELQEKHPAEARRLLELARPMLTDRDPRYAAEANFLLADAMWAKVHDRPRALALAKSARDSLAKIGAPPPRLAEVDTWLRLHAPP